MRSVAEPSSLFWQTCEPEALNHYLDIFRTAIRQPILDAGQAEIGVDVSQSRPGFAGLLQVTREGVRNHDRTQSQHRGRMSGEGTPRPIERLRVSLDEVKVSGYGQVLFSSGWIHRAPTA